MRQIKFRAWDKQYKRMLPLDEIHFGDGGEGKTISSWTERPEYPGDTFQLVFGENAEVMQFTGLHDRNGKEIYEGDLLRFHDEESPEKDPPPGSVEFKDGCFMIKHGDPLFDAQEIGILANDTVVGNIYENPELLKEEIL